MATRTVSLGRGGQAAKKEAGGGTVAESEVPSGGGIRNGALSLQTKGTRLGLVRGAGSPARHLGGKKQSGFRRTVRLSVMSQRWSAGKGRRAGSDPMRTRSAVKVPSTAAAAVAAAAAAATRAASSSAPAATTTHRAATAAVGRTEAFTPPPAPHAGPATRAASGTVMTESPLAAARTAAGVGASSGATPVKSTRSPSGTVSVQSPLVSTMKGGSPHRGRSADKAAVHQSTGHAGVRTGWGGTSAGGTSGGGTSAGVGAGRGGRARGEREESPPPPPPRSIPDAMKPRPRPAAAPGGPVRSFNMDGRIARSLGTPASPMRPPMPTGRIAEIISGEVGLDRTATLEGGSGGDPGAAGAAHPSSAWDGIAERRAARQARREAEALGVAAAMSRSSEPKPDAGALAPSKASPELTRTAVLTPSKSGGVSVMPGSPAYDALTANIKTKKAPYFRRPKKPKILKRATRSEEEIEKREAEKKLGKKINKEHELYHMSFGMMLGIYVSVNSGASGEPLTLDDFMAVNKLEFPTGGSDKTPPHMLPHSFKFKDYCPKVFSRLRERFDIDQAEYLRSLGGWYEYIEFVSNSKSGSFFFYSHDGKFMIKTQSPEESKFLRRIMAHYYEYVMENPDTMVTRFFGMHRVKMRHLRRKIHFVIMQSVFYGDNDIHEMYDLKGSTYGRAAKPKELEKGIDKCVLKDLDLMKRNVKLKLGHRRRHFLDIIERDAKFLARMKIMDYSLLVGIHRKSAKGHKKGVRRRSVRVPSLVSRGKSRTVSTLGSLSEGPEGEGEEPGDSAPPSREASPSAESREAHSAWTTAMTPAGTRGRGMGGTPGSTPGRTPGGAFAGTPGPMRKFGDRSAFPPTPGYAGDVEGVFKYEEDPSADEGKVEIVDTGIRGIEPDGRDADEIYYMGIIDILQQYDLKKSTESFFKGIFITRSTISAVNPDRYADRFVKFLADNSQ